MHTSSTKQVVQSHEQGSRRLALIRLSLCCQELCCIHIASTHQVVQSREQAPQAAWLLAAFLLVAEPADAERSSEVYVSRQLHPVSLLLRLLGQLSTKPALVLAQYSFSIARALQLPSPACWGSLLSSGRAARSQVSCASRSRSANSWAPAAGWKLPANWFCCRSTCAGSHFD